MTTTETIPPKPKTYNGNLRKLPDALAYLREQKIWVCWRWTWNGRKWTKPPLRADDPDHNASASDPATWGSHARAVKQVLAGRADGIGFAIKGLNIGGIDLDKCRDSQTGLIYPWAREILERFPDAYVEVTVSGTGLRILGASTLNLSPKFKLPDKGDGAAIELFCNSNHYLTVSFNELDFAACRKLPSIEDGMTRIAAEFGNRKVQDDDFDILLHVSAPVDTAADAEPSNNEETKKPKAWTFAEELRIRSALHSIPTDERLLTEKFKHIGGSDKVWINIGMALAGLGWNGREYAIFRDWSAQNAAEFNEKALRTRWGSLVRNRNSQKKPVTIASLFWYAQQFGWRWQTIPAKAAAPDYGSTLGFVPYAWPDAAAIPPRGFIYSKDYIRKTCSAVVGAGGRTKTTLLLTEAIGMACGRNLLTGDALTPLRVLLLNAEEPQDELDRRTAAICRLHNVTPEDCDGRLEVRSVRNKSPRFALRGENGPTLNNPALNALETSINTHHIDIVLFDPWISFHAVAENLSEEQDLVIKEGLGGVAERTDCAFGIGHHTGKPKAGQASYTADDARGSSAFIWAVRNARILNFMTTQEAAQLGVPEADRRRYIRVDTDKANMSPLGNVRWMHIVTELLPNGDEIACLTEWIPKDPFEGVTTHDMDWCRTGANRSTYRWDLRSPDWIGYALAERLKLPVKHGQKNPRELLTKLKRILETWLKNNVFALENRKDDKRRDRLYVVPAKDTEINLDDNEERDDEAA